MDRHFTFIVQEYCFMVSYIYKYESNGKEDIDFGHSIYNSLGYNRSK